MSGGEYDYIYQHIDELASRIRLQGECQAASPELRQAFKDHLYLVQKACRAIEWNDSGDGDEAEERLIKRCLGIKA